MTCARSRRGARRATDGASERRAGTALRAGGGRAHRLGRRYLDARARAVELFLAVDYKGIAARCGRPAAHPRARRRGAAGPAGFAAARQAPGVYLKSDDEYAIAALLSDGHASRVQQLDFVYSTTSSS